MSNKFGILVKDLSASQLVYTLVRSVNELVQTHKDLDIIIFYENYVLPCMMPQVVTMQLFEAWGFNAPIIATDLSTVSKLINFPGSATKFFYVYDLEWIRYKNKSFHDFVNVYSHPYIDVIARSQSHAKIIEDCWNIKVQHIMDDFENNKLLELISGTAN
jgi:hypothetical protein